MRRLRCLAVLAALCLTAACSGGAAVSGPSAGPSDDCGDVETVPIQGGAHLIGDRPPPVPYNSTPPTSGWHSSGGFAIGVRGAADPLSEPQQVSVLEAGGVVVTHRGLAPQDLAILEEAAGAEFAGQVAVTPYDALDDGEVAFTAWGTVQHCDAVDLDALRGFVGTYGDPEPSVPGEH